MMGILFSRSVLRDRAIGSVNWTGMVMAGILKSGTLAMMTMVHPHRVALTEGNPDCLMGHKQYFWRRRQEAECYVGEKYKDPEPKDEDCQCTDEDYEWLTPHKPQLTKVTTITDVKATSVFSVVLNALSLENATEKVIDTPHPVDIEKSPAIHVSIPTQIAKMRQSRKSVAKKVLKTPNQQYQ